jgi:hypothetical protein
LIVIFSLFAFFFEELYFIPKNLNMFHVYIQNNMK